MIRKIIHIDEDKCNGCGLCATACHEGAIDIIDGKAKLVRENFCDGFGDCLARLPTEPSPLKNERHLHMMRRPCRKARRKRNYRKR